MSAQTGPRWAITFRRAGAETNERAVVHCATLVGAIKLAIAEIEAALPKGMDFKMISVDQIDERPEPLASDTSLLFSGGEAAKPSIPSPADMRRSEVASGPPSGAEPRLPQAHSSETD